MKRRADMATERDVTESLIDGDERVSAHAPVTDDRFEPDPEIPRDELEWWLGVQERIDTRTALADAGLL
jgi:hypothetical protein